jgi:transposase
MQEPPMPYSTDLRQRVVDAYNQDIAVPRRMQFKQSLHREVYSSLRVLHPRWNRHIMITYKEVAARFSVSVSFVSAILSRHRKSGSVSPKIREEQTPTKLSDEQLLILKEMIKEDNDATLEELCKALEKKVNVKISVSTMGRMTQKLGITVKKNKSRQPKR